MPIFAAALTAFGDSGEAQSSVGEQQVVVLQFARAQLPTQLKLRALPRKADIGSALARVHFGPIADIPARQDRSRIKAFGCRSERETRDCSRRRRDGSM